MNPKYLDFVERGFAENHLSIFLCFRVSEGQSSVATSKIQLNVVVRARGGETVIERHSHVHAVENQLRRGLCD